MMRRLCGQPRIGPSGVVSQANPAIRRPISPPPARKSTGADTIPAVLIVSPPNDVQIVNAVEATEFHSTCSMSQVQANPFDDLDQDSSFTGTEGYSAGRPGTRQSLLIFRETCWICIRSQRRLHEQRLRTRFFPSRPLSIPRSVRTSRTASSG